MSGVLVQLHNYGTVVLLLCTRVYTEYVTDDYDRNDPKRSAYVQ